MSTPFGCNFIYTFCGSKLSNYLKNLTPFIDYDSVKNFHLFAFSFVLTFCKFSNVPVNQKAEC